MYHAPVNRILFGAVAPVCLFYLGHQLNHPMTGAILASTWGLAFMGQHWFRQRELDAFSAIGAAYSVAELTGLLATRNPDWYLIAPTVSDWVMAAVFLGSMATRKPLIQMLAEQTAGPETFDAVRKSGYYRKLWLRLSLFWGMASIIRGGLNWILMATMSTGSYLIGRAMLGWPVTMMLIALSFWYPKRYWHKVLS